MQEMIAERVAFKSLTEASELISEEEILSWLLNSNNIEFKICDEYFKFGSPKCSLMVDEVLPISSIEIFNLDPASAAVLVAGLSAILAWVSTERRHKETMKNTPSGNTGNGDIDKPDVCKKVEDENICNLPLSNTMRVKGDGFLILFRACTKKPEPHTTVEYYEL